jgi:DNA-binding transcriptional LysR family regulator
VRPFDLVDLNLFVAVAEAGNITRAAGRAGLALASASARIRHLEETLGVTLLERQRLGVKLTPAGERLLDHARLVLHQVAEMRSEAASYAGGVRGHIRILSNTSAASEHLPCALAPFLAKHPAISIDVEERKSPDIALALASGIGDIGIAVESAMGEGLDHFRFCDDRLVMICARADDLARKRLVGLAEIADRPFVGLSEGMALQDHLAIHAARLGRRLNMRARIRTFDAIGRLVEAGVGIAVIPEIAARRCAQAMKIKAVRMSDPWAERHLAIATRARQALPKAARQLVDHLKAVAKA